MIPEKLGKIVRSAQHNSFMDIVKEHPIKFLMLLFALLLLCGGIFELWYERTLEQKGKSVAGTILSVKTVNLRANSAGDSPNTDATQNVTVEYLENDKPASIELSIYGKDLHPGDLINLVQLPGSKPALPREESAKWILFALCIIFALLFMQPFLHQIRKAKTAMQSAAPEAANNH